MNPLIMILLVAGLFCLFLAAISYTFKRRAARINLLALGLLLIAVVYAIDRWPS